MSIDERELHLATVKILLGIRWKLKSIDKDIDDLIKIIAREYGLDVVLEAGPSYVQ